MKWFHNDKVSLAWAVIVEIVVHAMFASQSFLLGEFIGEVTHVGAPVGSWMLAIAIFGAAFQAFVLGEYMREHVEAFEKTPKGNKSYMRSWKQIRWIVGGIEVSSMLFRCYAVIVTDHDYVQAGIVLLFGTMALWYAFAQAKIIHASVNRPVEYDVNRVRQQAGRSIVTDALDMIPQMTAEQKRRFYTGDLSAIDEVYQSDLAKQQEKLRAIDAKRESKQQKEREKQQAKEAKRREKEEEQERKRQRQLEEERTYQESGRYTKRLLGDPDEEGPSYPFLQAVPTNQPQQDGTQRGA